MDPCKYEDDIKEVRAKVNEIHNALLGDFEKRGLVSKVFDLEAWRNSATNRVKTRLTWMWGLIGSISGGVIVGLVLAITLRMIGIK